MATIPSIVDGPPLAVRRVIEFDLPCPKCQKDIRVTNVKPGAVMQCQHEGCSNVTWRPDYRLPWWGKTSHFIGSLASAFVVGFASSFFASLAFERYAKPGNVGTDVNVPAVVTKP